MPSTLELVSERPTNLPIPLAQIQGQRLLVYQDEVDLRYGQLYLPQKQATERRPTRGTVVQVGDGFLPHEWINYYDVQQGDAFNRQQTTAAWHKVCPIKIGDRVLWSRYEDLQISLPVDPSWWTQEDIEKMKKLRREEEVVFIVLDVAQVALVITDNREKDVWED